TRKDQEIFLRQIQHFLTTLEAPQISDPQQKRRFLNKATQFFVKDGKLFKRHKNKPPLLVIFEASQKMSILMQAHE
ncbi:hypothetical protein FA15DRAFT_546737, partial [Coprinopsis marcescibilis]